MRKILPLLFFGLLACGSALKARVPTNIDSVMRSADWIVCGIILNQDQKSGSSTDTLRFENVTVLVKEIGERKDQRVPVYPGDTIRGLSYWTTGKATNSTTAYTMPLHYDSTQVQQWS